MKFMGWELIPIALICLPCIYTFFKRESGNDFALSNWKPDITNYHLLTWEKMDFVFNQVQQCHLNTLENRKLLEQKALAIAGVLVTISTAVLGFLATHLDFKKAFEEQEWGLILPILALVSLFYWAMYLVIKALHPVKYFPPGNEPQYIVTQEHFDQPLSWMLYAEAYNMQERITTNNKLNDQKARAIQKALFISAIAPLISIALLVLIALVQSGSTIFNMLALWIGRLT